MNTFPAKASTSSEREICQFIKDRYDLQGEYSCKLFRTGVNHTYFISGGKEKLVTRVYCHNWRTKIEIEQELALLNLLKEKSLSVSYPVADTQGNLIQPIQAPEGLRYAVVFSFAEGQKIRFMSNQTCFSIGSLMAIQKIERRSLLISEDAAMRYLAFMAKIPASSQSYPTFLFGILPWNHTIVLRRIRKNIR